MNLRKPAESFLAPSCELQDHTPAIVEIVGSANEPCEFAPLAEFNGCVVLKAHRFSDVRDRSQSSVWSTRDLQQKLMLLRLQTRCRCCLLAKS